MIFLKLFLSFLQVGALSIGGGYAAIPLIRDRVVTATGWMTMSEFTDLVTIAEMTPGPIVVNAATFVGIRVAGIPGAIVATLGCVLPSCVIVSLLAFIYFRFKKVSALQSVLATLRPAVVALIAAAGLSILQTAVWDSGLNLVGLCIFAAAFFVLRRFKPGPIPVLALSGAAGLLFYGIL